MIRLIDLLNEDVNSPEFNNDKHWRDHFNEIIQCAETALKSNDPEIIAKQVAKIIEHADVALDKHEATYSKEKTPTFRNSNIANSYSQNADEDINGYDGGSRI